MHLVNLLKNPSLICSVQPSWRDRTELFGYYNDFTKKYTKTEFLKTLYEAHYYEDMKVVILDEMNIARVEYYFAEMLSLLEMPREDERYFSVVSSQADNDPLKMKEGKVWIPSNVWYVGTINKDKTFVSGELTNEVKNSIIIDALTAVVAPVDENTGIANYWQYITNAYTNVIDSSNNGKYLEIAIYLQDQNSTQRMSLPVGTTAIIYDDEHPDGKVVNLEYGQSVIYYYKNTSSQYTLDSITQDTYKNHRIVLDFSQTDLKDYADSNYDIYMELIRTSDPNYPMSSDRQDDYSKAVATAVSKNYYVTYRIYQKIINAGNTTYELIDNSNIKLLDNDSNELTFNNVNNMYYNTYKFSLEEIKDGSSGTAGLVTRNLSLQIETMIDDIPMDLSNYKIEMHLVPYDDGAQDVTDDVSTLKDFFVFTVGKLKTDM